MAGRSIRPLVAVVALLTLVEATSARQSPTAAAVRFEAASIKASDKDDPLGTNQLFEFVPNGDVRLSNITLRLAIALAYDVSRFNELFLVGTQPSLQQRFHIHGKAPAGAAGGQGRSMLRTLLEERFGLRTHTERREIPVYALTVARPGRLGRNLRETTTDCSRFDRRNEPADSPLAKACSNSGRRDAQKSQLRESGPMALFMERLANQGALDRPLEDRTGLTGLFEWDLTFRIDRNPASDSEFPPVESALTDQLGLRLAAATAMREVRIIDNVEAPSAD